MDRIDYRWARNWHQWKFVSDEHLDDRTMSLDSIVVICLGGLLFGLVAWGLRFVYGYRLTETTLNIMLFGCIPIFRLPLKEIESIKKVGWKEVGIGGITLRLGNRMLGSCILIHRKTGWIRNVLITPSDPEQFLADMAARIER